MVLPKIGPASTPKTLPTRVLDVYRQTYSEHDTIRLIKVANQKDICYLALSHCWGDHKDFMTTTATLDDRLTGFEVANLSRSYRDAVKVTRELGFRYLWIDALCIVQNDLNEWHTESSNMGDIFKNAYCTLFAHSSRGNNEGFLRSALSSRITVRLGRAISRQFFASPMANLDADVTHSNLCSRGWVLQERFLSTRIIHFTPGMLYFETAQGVQAEDGTIWRPPNPADGEWTGITGHRKSRYFGPSAVPNLICLFQGVSQAASSTPPEWHPLVEMYSSCKLSRERDKLIAISGMVKYIQKCTGVPYYAGIWGDKIAAGLLWLPGDQNLVYPKENRAPSWSWAAVDGPIQYPLDISAPSFTPLCEVIDAQQQGTGEHTTCLQGPGFMSIKAAVYNLSLDSVEIDEKVELLGPGPHVHMTESDLSLPNVRAETRARRLKQKDRLVGWIVLDQDSGTGHSLETDRKNVGLLCFAVASVGAPSSSPLSFGTCYALFLVPVEPSTHHSRTDSGIDIPAWNSARHFFRSQPSSSSNVQQERQAYKRIGMGLLCLSYRSQNLGCSQTIHIC